MAVEKSAGAVIFYRAPRGKIEYLLLQHDKKWGFPKGLIEDGEKLEETALREAGEETGLENLTIIKGFKETIKMFFKVKYPYQLERGFKMGENVLKFVTYFLMKSEDKEVKLSFEHEGCAWLPFKDALEKLKGYKNLQAVLEKANRFLSGKK